MNLSASLIKTSFTDEIMNKYGATQKSIIKENL